MAEKDILTNIQNTAKDDLDFYSNKGKPEREKWVITDFLNKLCVAFKESDIVSLPQQNKIDVKFGSANFQVKEIVDPGILRTREAKERYLSFKDAKSLSDIKLPPSHVRDVPDVTRMYDLVLDESNNLADSPNYKDIKNEIDLIFYVTRTKSSIIQSEEINIDDFQQLGWRSISCLNAKQAIVLYASQEAPKFLKNK